MSYSSSGTRSVRFADFELSLETGEIRKADGSRVVLPEQPFRILATLIGQSGNLVSRDDLRRRLWPEDTFVDFEHSLNAAIKRLREALGDSATAPRFIQTIPRRGYRFIGTIENVNSSPAPDPTLPLKREKLTKNRILRRWRIYGVVAVFIVLLAYLYSAVSHREPAPEFRSIAVLPFTNLSGDPAQEYFADGMTESLINALGQIQALKVISRTSVFGLKETTRPVLEIARELKVDAVVEGSAKRVGSRLQIMIQLVDARSEKNIWTGNFEREWTDVLSLQNDMVRAIVDEIRIQVTPEERNRMALAAKTNPEAHEAYLIARYHLLKYIPSEFEIAKDYFQRAIEIDPRYAAAYAGLSHTWWQIGYMGRPTLKEVEGPARAAAEKALELDDRLAEAHVAQGYLKALYDWDWKGAENSLRRALELDPNNVDAHFMNAKLFTALGRFPEAIAAIQRAQDLDPTAPSIQSFFGKILLWAGRPDDAIVQLKKAIELEPRQPFSYERLGEVYEHQGKYADAISWYERARDVRASPDPRLPIFNMLVARVYARTGRQSDAVRILEKLSGAAPGVAASGYAALGDRNRAFQLLHKVIDEHDGDGNFFIKTEPAYAPLYSDPRWRELLSHMNLVPEIVLP